MHKKYVTIFFLFLFSIVASAQVTFHKSFGGAYSSHTSALETSDHGYIIAGTNLDSAFYSCLIRIDSIGNLVWSKQYSTGGVSSPLSQTPDGGFIYACFGSRIIRVDQSGNLLWAHTHYINGILEFRSIVPTSDSGFIVCGRIEHFAPNQTNICLLKIDSVGNVSWSKEYGGTIFSEMGIYAAQTNDSGYIIMGTYDVSSTLIIKVDSIGNVIWSYIFGNAIFENDYKIYQTSDGGFVMSGFYSNKVSLIKINDIGTFQWARLYQPDGSAICPGLELTNDGGFILAGQTNNKSYVIKTNSLGDTLWTRIYGNSVLEGSMAIHQTSDGGYLIAGYRDSSSEISVFKTDGTGSISCESNSTSTIVDTIIISPYGGSSGSTFLTTVDTLNINVTAGNVMNTICTSVGIDEIQAESPFTIFPNPTTGKFSITGLDSNSISKAEFEIFNLTGEKVLTLQSQAEADIPNLRSGIYFVKLSSGKKIYRTKLIKQ
jgi:hypothetical protein